MKMNREWMLLVNLTMMTKRESFNARSWDTLRIFWIWVKINFKKICFVTFEKNKKEISLWVGFEPTPTEWIWFRVKRLNHSATKALKALNFNRQFSMLNFFYLQFCHKKIFKSWLKLTKLKNNFFCWDFSS